MRESRAGGWPLLVATSAADMLVWVAKVEFDFTGIRAMVLTSCLDGKTANVDGVLSIPTDRGDVWQEDTRLYL